MMQLDSKSKENYTSVIKAIQNNQCCAFIGAGLSLPAEYPLWIPLLDQIKEVIKTKGGVFEESSNEKPYDRAERYQEILGEREFLKIIVDIFNPHKDKQPFNQVHLDLIELPFVSYITTNYDCSLENAAKRYNLPIKKSCYPTLPTSKIRERRIYHIHGILDFENPDTLERMKTTLIITRKDAEEAYKTDTSIHDLLKVIYKELVFLFIGFDLKDEYIRDIFLESGNEYNTTNEISIRRSQEPLKSIRHYAFMENPKLDQNNEKRFIGSIMSEEEKRVELRKKQDCDFKEMGINPIWYDGDSRNHTQLIELIHEIYLQVKGIKERPIPYDLTFRGE